MHKLAIAQLRAHKSRYTAMIMAIVVGIAFFTASLAGVTSSQATLNKSLGALYTNSTVLVSPIEGQDAAAQQLLRPSLQKRVEALPGVSSTHLQQRNYGQLNTAKGDRRSLVALSLPEHADQRPFTLLGGEAPQRSGEVLVDQDSADKYGIKIGDRIKADFYGPDAEQARHLLTVTGLFDPLHTPDLAGSIQTFMPEQFLTELQTPVSALLVATEADDVIPEVFGALSAQERSVLQVKTVQEHLSDMTSAGGDFLPIAMVLTVFSLIALAVMTLVINNTFSVIVAQRTREMGLLRIVGSTKAQVFRMVLGEALIIGLLASLVGVAVGLGLLAGALALAGAIWDIDFISFAMDANAIIWPLLAGTLATVLAAWRPARNATRVQPVQALAPELLENAGSKVSALRVVTGLLLLGGGAAGLYYFVFSAPEILLAMFSGLVSFIGVLVLTPVFIPPLVSGLGRLLRPFGIPGVQARLNAARHPRRSATTAAALLIGSTLIVMMISGAESMKRVVNDELDQRMPLDVYVHVLGDEDAAQPQNVLVRANVLVKEHTAEVVPVYQLNDEPYSVYAVDAKQISAASRQGLAGPAPGQVLTENEEAGSTRTVAGRKLTVAPNPFGSTMDPLVNAADFSDQDLQLAMYVIKLSKPIPAADLEEYRDRLAEDLRVEPSAIAGTIFERAVYEQLINVILSVVNAMLAVALIIAFIGVANTLTLSTIERQRENGLLRAIGLTRQGLRAMLTLEALLISAVAVLVGCVLGVVYGWFGANVLLVTDQVALLVPWLPLLVIVAVALLCAMLAATIPARRALKLAPVQALTE